MAIERLEALSQDQMQPAQVEKPTRERHLQSVPNSGALAPAIGHLAKVNAFDAWAASTLRAQNKSDALPRISSTIAESNADRAALAYGIARQPDTSLIPEGNYWGHD